MEIENEDEKLLATDGEAARVFGVVAGARKTDVSQVARSLNVDFAQALEKLRTLQSAHLVESTDAPIPALKVFYLTEAGFRAQKRLDKARRNVAGH
jgi:hypothetical protein